MESYRIIPNAIPSIVDSTVKTKLIKLKKVADDIHLYKELRSDFFYDFP
jgi:hypothetical protein